MAIPDEATQALPILRRCLGDSLTAVFLYGSAVSGGLRPSSDVDLMVIVDAPTTPAVRKDLVVGLMRVSGRHPARPDGPRPLELIVFQRADIASPAYPARSELLYGEWLRREFEAGATPEPASDPDFTLVLAQARREAKTLVGPAPEELLPRIPDADIRRAIGDALPGLVGNLDGDERNVLLTLARMWRTLTTGEFVPKDVAAAWAAARLTPEGAVSIARARNGYLGTEADDWRPLRAEARRLADELSERVRATL